MDSSVYMMETTLIKHEKHTDNRLLVSIYGAFRSS